MLSNLVLQIGERMNGYTGWITLTESRFSKGERV
jgi:hypothetical protein